MAKLSEGFMTLFLSYSPLTDIPSFPHIHLGTVTPSPFPFSMDSYLQTHPLHKYLPLF